VRGSPRRGAAHQLALRLDPRLGKDGLQLGSGRMNTDVQVARCSGEIGPGGEASYSGSPRKHTRRLRRALTKKKPVPPPGA
jgi:hypothetical protein